MALCLWNCSCRSPQEWIKCIGIINVACTHPSGSWSRDFLQLVMLGYKCLYLFKSLLKSLLQKSTIARQLYCTPDLLTEGYENFQTPYDIMWLPIPGTLLRTLSRARILLLHRGPKFHFQYIDRNLSYFSYFEQKVKKTFIL